MNTFINTGMGERYVHLYDSIIRMLDMWTYGIFEEIFQLYPVGYFYK